MKKIPLTQGKFALVDDSDYENLVKFDWQAIKSGYCYYAVRNGARIKGKRTPVRMHMVIMETPKGMETDHIDGDGLNNQRKNLRVCTRSENQHNRTKYKNNTSGFKGVVLTKYKNSIYFRAQIVVDGKKVYLGSFSSDVDAYKAYCDACIRYHGEFSNLK